MYAYYFSFPLNRTHANVELLNVSIITGRKSIINFIMLPQNWPSMQLVVVRDTERTMLQGKKWHRECGRPDQT